MPFTGKDLIVLGHKPAKWFGEAIKLGEQGYPLWEAVKMCEPPPLPDPVPLRPHGITVTINIEPPETQVEYANYVKVLQEMEVLTRTPTIKTATVMPDACPVGGPAGTIPVGGVVACENAIHPGFHSSDICCSLACSVFSPSDRSGTYRTKELLDAGMRLSHFGAGGRSFSHDMVPSTTLRQALDENPFTNMLDGALCGHYGTQGDGNHFLYVGRRKSDGSIALVTHHGSRKPGAMLFKRGMACAEEWRRKIAPDVPAHNAWIPADSEDGTNYWAALQLIRQWTKGSHFAIHDTIAKYLGLRVVDRFWNEHNFVFQKTDGLFYHAKGATPAYDYFSADTDNRTLIPMNMREPILITRGSNSAHALGFSPHGAGRNISRTAFTKANLGASAPEGIDLRWYTGRPDISELPEAYKDAASVRNQISMFGLATIEDQIDPYGCIMAGQSQWEYERKKKLDKVRQDGASNSNA